METEKYEILNDAKRSDSIDELIGFSYVEYEFPDDGTDYHNAIVMEDSENWFIDLGLGLGFAQYHKCDFTLDEAIADQSEWKME